MDTLQRFLTMYEDQAERLDSSLLASREELDRTQDRAEQIEKELAILERRQDDNLVRLAIFVYEFLKVNFFLHLVFFLY